MTRTHLIAVNCCVLMAQVTQAAPKPLPSRKPIAGAQRPAGKMVKPPLVSQRKTLVLPPTGSKLSQKPRPRQPSAVAANGGNRPDARSAGLADQRLRANALAPEFSLEDAIALCLANNPRRNEAQAGVNAATANIGVVGSQGKFQVGLNGTTEYGRNTSTSNAIATASQGSSSGSEDGGGDGGSGGNEGGSPTAASPSRSFLRFDQVALNASLPITDGGAVRASTRQARYVAVAQIYQLAQVEQDLILSTTLSYLDVLRSQQLLRVTNANLSVSQERLRIARIRYGVGASARLDVLQAETALADARSRRIQAVNALGISNTNLNIALGRAPETPIRVASISRLNLPDVAYTIRPSSVLATSGRNASDSTPAAPRPASTSSSNAGRGTAGNRAGSAPAQNGRRNGAARNGAARNSSPRRGQSNTNDASTSGAATNPGAVFSGPSAPSNLGAAGGSSTATGGRNPMGQRGGSTIGSGANSNGVSTQFPSSASSSSSSTATAGSATPAGGASGNAGTGSAQGGASGSMATLGTSQMGSDASAGLQSLAGGTRQSLAVTTAQIGAAQAAIDIAKAGKKPRLGLNLGALLRNPATFLGNFGASIGLGLAQNLFDSGRTRDQVNNAQAALQQLQARLEGQRLEVAGAIETSLLNLDSAQRRQTNSEAGVASAREGLRVAQIGFRSGVRTTLDLANAQASLLAAETDAVNSRFDVADAQATLAAAVGIYTVEAQNARQRSIAPQTDPAKQAGKQIEILDPKPRKKRRKFLGIF